MLVTMRLVPSIAALSFLYVVGCGVAGSERRSNTQSNGYLGAIPVQVSRAEAHLSDSTVSGPGIVVAYSTAVVKSRVDGEIVEIAFTEGQDVKKGDLLATIDPRPYESSLHQLEATLAKDQAALQDARVSLERYRMLFDAKLIAVQQVDAQAATVRQAEGTVRVDQAQIESAKLNLAYTRITSPLAGRVGLKLTDVGNMVRTTDTNGVAIVTQLQPIAVLFTVPQQFLESILTRLRGGLGTSVDVYSEDDRHKIETGKFLTIDNQIDTTTGTPRLKAIFDNKNFLLWPNESVNVRMRISAGSRNIAVPTDSIRRDRSGAFVYLVHEDNTVEARSVTVLGQQGNRVILNEGVRVGDVIVVSEQGKLYSGAHIIIMSDKLK